MQESAANMATADCESGFYDDYLQCPDTEDWNTNEYSYTEENPWMNVQTSPLSTFAADVDTASYTQIRSAIENGYDIDPSMVRIEEMLNYFHYDYPLPKGNEKFAVYTEYADCPWNKDTKLALVAMNTQAIDFKEAPASNLVFLIDVSGSMFDDNKLPLVQQACDPHELACALALLGAFVSASAQNAREMAAIRGYEIVAHTLRGKAALLDTACLREVCRMVGFDLTQSSQTSQTTQSERVVRNRAALAALLVRFDHWRQSNDASLMLAVCRALESLVRGGGAAASHNARCIHAAGAVPALLRVLHEGLLPDAVVPALGRVLEHVSARVRDPADLRHYAVLATSVLTDAPVPLADTARPARLCAMLLRLVLRLLQPASPASEAAMRRYVTCSWAFRFVAPGVPPSIVAAALRIIAAMYYDPQPPEHAEAPPADAAELDDAVSYSAGAAGCGAGCGVADAGTCTKRKSKFATDVEHMGGMYELAAALPCLYREPEAYLALVAAMLGLRLRAGVADPQQLGIDALADPVFLHRARIRAPGFLALLLLLLAKGFRSLTASDTSTSSPTSSSTSTATSSTSQTTVP